MQLIRRNRQPARSQFGANDLNIGILGLGYEHNFIADLSASRYIQLCCHYVLSHSIKQKIAPAPKRSNLEILDSPTLANHFPTQASPLVSATVLIRFKGLFLRPLFKGHP
jgi:hypothetical protein